MLEESLEEIEGYGTGLRPANGNSNAPVGSKELELFIRALERKLLYDSLYNLKPISETTSQTTNKVQSCLRELSKNSNNIVVPTDKTNKWVLVEVEKYNKWMMQHICKDAIEILRRKLKQVYNKRMDILEEISWLMGKKEKAAVQESLNSKSIPQPQLLVKDHKLPNEEGDFPTRFLVPAKNYCSVFSQFGCKAIQTIFRKHNVKLDKYQLNDSAHLKNDLE